MNSFEDEYDLILIISPVHFLIQHGVSPYKNDFVLQRKIKCSGEVRYLHISSTESRLSKCFRGYDYNPGVDGIKLFRTVADFVHHNVMISVT